MGKLITNALRVACEQTEPNGYGLAVKDLEGNPEKTKKRDSVQGK